MILEFKKNNHTTFFLLFCKMWFKRKHVSVVGWEFVNMWNISESKILHSVVYVDLVFTYFEFDPDQSLFSNIYKAFLEELIFWFQMFQRQDTLYRYSMTENTSGTASIDLTEFT